MLFCWNWCIVTLVQLINRSISITAKSLTFEHMDDHIELLHPVKGMLRSL